MASAERLLRPVRLRIIQALLGDRAPSTGEIAAELADVPAATLYRQVARLADAGVLQVAAAVHLDPSLPPDPREGTSP